MPKTQVSKVEALKEIIRAWGINPGQILTQGVLSEGATKYNSHEDLENTHFVILSNPLRELMMQEK
ncbi:MAG TPA: hypothetical protein VJY36_05920 [Candidatus Bathyarchaeia archaeon]|nr:hypothetical protein [Candidatus Bathyarchaeia archaeon]